MNWCKRKRREKFDEDQRNKKLKIFLLKHFFFIADYFFKMNRNSALKWLLIQQIQLTIVSNLLIEILSFIYFIAIFMELIISLLEFRLTITHVLTFLKNYCIPINLLFSWFLLFYPRKINNFIIAECLINFLEKCDFNMKIYSIGCLHSMFCAHFVIIFFISSKILLINFNNLNIIPKLLFE